MTDAEIADRDKACEGFDPPVSDVDGLPDCAGCCRHAARLPDLYHAKGESCQMPTP
jgi:hypothetical protein